MQMCIYVYRCRGECACVYAGMLYFTHPFSFFKHIICFSYDFTYVTVGVGARMFTLERLILQTFSVVQVNYMLQRCMYVCVGVGVRVCLR